MLSELVLLALIPLSRGSFLDFFRYFDINLLDEKIYCEVVIDTSHFEDIEFDQLPLYVSFNEPTCHPALFVKSLAMDFINYQNCEQRSMYIKDPNMTYLFINDQLHDLEKYFNDRFVQLPCILEDQPYFFIVTRQENNLTIDEIQVFSKSIQSVAKFERAESGWLQKPSWPDVYLRRSNFQGNEILAHYDDDKIKGIIDQNGRFTGYHGDIGTMIQKAFNFSLTLHPIQVYGIKTGDNEYTGTVSELYKHKIDVAMANFHQIPDRLEATKGGYSMLLFAPELIFWGQEHDRSTFIYTLVFDLKTWIAIIFMIILFSVTYFFIHFDDNIIESILEAMAISVKALVVLDLDYSSSRRRMANRTLILTLSFTGALLYWSYTGNLISYFTIESEKPPIVSFEDILNTPNMKLLMRKGTSYSQHLLNAMNKDPHLKKKLPERIIWHTQNSVMYKDFMTAENKAHLMMFKQFLFTMVYLRGSYDPDSLCKVRHGLLHNIRAQEITGWLYPKNSLLTKLFDRFIIKLSESGIERELFLKYFEGIPQDKCEAERQPIHFNIVVILFTILGIGCVLCLCVLCFEIIYVHIKK